MDQECLIALGANLPLDSQTPVESCQQALASLSENGARPSRISRFFHTPAFPAGIGPDYINAVCAVSWSGSGDDLLATLHKVEQSFERTRDTRWGARTLDLDLLTLGDKIVPDAHTYAHWAGLDPQTQANQAPRELILPHPRIAERAFVLVPMHDVAPAWRHPVTGLSVAQMLSALDAGQIGDVTPL